MYAFFVYEQRWCRYKTAGHVRIRRSTSTTAACFASRRVSKNRAYMLVRAPAASSALQWPRGLYSSSELVRTSTAQGLKSSARRSSSRQAPASQQQTGLSGGVACFLSLQKLDRESHGHKTLFRSLKARQVHDASHFPFPPARHGGA